MLRKRQFSVTLGLPIALAACLLCCTVGEAKKGGVASYTILDLPGLFHAEAGGWSYTYAEKISDPASDDTVYVLGWDRSADPSVPCLWTIDANRSITAEDITPWIDTINDVNSARIVCGMVDERPALLLADNSVVLLAAVGETGRVMGINNPNQLGVFQAVGYVQDLQGEYHGRLWDLTLDGTLLETTTLTAPAGESFYARDINDSVEMAGVVAVEGGNGLPATGAFDSNGVLQITLLTNPGPTEIAGFQGLQIDADGNSLGFGYQLVSYYSYSRAVIWPIGGDAIDISGETNIATTEGNGIASVNGVMQVVGRAEDGGRGAFAYLYKSGQLQDLNPLSKGEQRWTLAHGEGVNSTGMICGFGLVGGRRDSQKHGFLLIPQAP